MNFIMLVRLNASFKMDEKCHYLLEDNVSHSYNRIQFLGLGVIYTPK